jgi:hypothetical protein
MVELVQGLLFIRKITVVGAILDKREDVLGRGVDHVRGGDKCLLVEPVSNQISL